MTPTASSADADSLARQARDHLVQALETEDPEMKEYHIRSALQFCVIQTSR